MSLAKFRAKHKGEGIFILGNGPSLRETDLDLLEEEVSIGMNEIGRIYDQTSWRPTYFVLNDVGGKYGKPEERQMRIFERNFKSDIESFINEKGKNHFKSAGDINYYSENVIPPEERKKALNNEHVEQVWSNDITNYICNFGSTLTIASQIAAYMGADNIYYLGCDLFTPTQYKIFGEAGDPLDHDFVADSLIGKSREFLKTNDSTTKSIVNGISYFIYSRLLNQLRDNNHFSNEYLMGRRIYKSDLNQKHIELHRLIQMASREYGFKVYNATVGGNLEVHPRKNLNDIVE